MRLTALILLPKRDGMSGALVIVQFDFITHGYDQSAGGLLAVIARAIAAVVGIELARDEDGEMS